MIGLGRGDGPVFEMLFDGLGTLDLDLDPAPYAPDDRGPAGLRRATPAGRRASSSWSWPRAAGSSLDLDPDDPFTADPSQLWQRVLRRQGGRTAMFASAPEDPSTN